MNTVHFLEIEQDGKSWPENPPILPVPIRKSAQQAIAPIHIQIRFRKAQSDRHRLK